MTKTVTPNVDDTTAKRVLFVAFELSEKTLNANLLHSSSDRKHEGGNNKLASPRCQSALMRQHRPLDNIWERAQQWATQSASERPLTQPRHDSPPPMSYQDDVGVHDDQN